MIHVFFITPPELVFLSMKSLLRPMRMRQPRLPPARGPAAAESAAAASTEPAEPTAKTAAAEVPKPLRSFPRELLRRVPENWESRMKEPKTTRKRISSRGSDSSFFSLLLRSGPWRWLLRVTPWDLAMASEITSTAAEIPPA